jgi:hypothetical protein
MENSSNKVELKTSTLMAVCMVAGVGFSNISVSEWWSVMLSTASLLFERMMDIVFALIGKDKPIPNPADINFEGVLQLWSLIL